MSYCTSCGTALEPGIRFCLDCGNAVAAPSVGHAADTTRNLTADQPTATVDHPTEQVWPGSGATWPDGGAQSQWQGPTGSARDAESTTWVRPPTSGAQPWPAAPFPGPPAPGHAGWGAEQGHRVRPRRTGVAVAAVAVLLLVIGGLAAWAALRRGAEASAPVVGPTSTLAAPGNQVPSTVTPVSPSSVGPTAAPADPDTVQLAQGAAFAPAAPAIQALLQRHFDAINARDFTAWAATVTPDRAGLSAASWTQSFRSTHDSQVVISRIEPAGPDSATVSLSFTSTQDVQDAPPDLRAGRICWQSTWPVVNLSAGGRIGAPPRGTTTKSAC